MKQMLQVHDCFLTGNNGSTAWPGRPPTAMMQSAPAFQGIKFSVRKIPWQVFNRGARPPNNQLPPRSRRPRNRFDDGNRSASSASYCAFIRRLRRCAATGAARSVLQTGKKDVEITAVEPVGNYAVRLVFSDGHDTGLYSWDYLYGLGEDKEGL